MRNFKAFRTLNVPQKCSVKYYTNAEMLKISKEIVQSVEYSPRPIRRVFKNFRKFLKSQKCEKTHVCKITACVFNYIYMNDCGAAFIP